MDEVVSVKQESSKAEEIIQNCLLVNNYLVTIKKAIIADRENIPDFVDHYSDLIEVAIKNNWENHDTAEQISRDDFRRNLKVE